VPGLEIVAVGSLREAIDVAFAGSRAASGGAASGDVPGGQAVAAGSARC